MESSNSMDEIYPGLWIGSIGALRVYENAYNDQDVVDHQSNRYWTIISLIDSETILHKFVNDILIRGRQQQQLQEEESSTAGQQRAQRIRHVSWRLKDKSNSILLCERLEEILSMIDDALRIQHHQRQQHASHEMDFIKTNSTVDSSSGGTSSNGDEKNCIENDSPSPLPTSCCLVHCAQGKSRSAAVCAAWFISRKGMSLQQALDTTRNARPQIQPNLGFIAGLRAVEQSNGNINEAINRMRERSTKK